MYINIDHIVKYTRSLNWLISAIFLCAIVVMSIIGYRLGVKIEESQKLSADSFRILLTNSKPLSWQFKAMPRALKWML